MNDSPGTAIARSGATAVQDTALGTTSEFSTELAPTAAAEAAKQEVQAAVILAKRFPRNEDEAYASIIRSCKRPTFAADTEYSFPRGGKTVKGPSIYLAREFARLWGNIRHGCDIVTDNNDERTIRAWAWDVQTNTKVSSDATFKKLVQRKQWDGDTKWVQPDERDLRELTNKHAAIAKRNCLLELLPSDMVEDACNAARTTLKDQAAQDPDAARKSLINAFSELNVPIVGLERYLGHPLAECSPEELANLRTIYKSIKDGNSVWADYTNGNGHSTEDLAAKTKAAAEKLKEKVKTADEPTDHVEPGLHDKPEDTEPVDEPDEEISEIEKLRANVEAALDELPNEQRKQVLLGKTGIGKMSVDDLNQLLIDIRKAKT